MLDYLYYKDVIINTCRNYIYPYLPASFDASAITDKIYISDLGTVYNHDELKKLGITHIINTAFAITNPYPNDFKYLTIPARDNSTEDLLQYFDQCFEFIEDCLKNNGKIIIHCVYGISRSSSVLIAFFIRKFRLSFEESYNAIKEKRTIIEPNEHFKKQLQEYAKRWMPQQKRSRKDI